MPQGVLLDLDACFPPQAFDQLGERKVVLLLNPLAQSCQMRTQSRDTVAALLQRLAAPGLLKALPVTFDCALAYPEALGCFRRTVPLLPRRYDTFTQIITVWIHHAPTDPFFIHLQLLN